jgi:nitrogen fixation protein FixH
MAIDRNTGGEGRPVRVVTGGMVFISLVAFFGVVAGVNAIMIRAAVSTFGGVETSSAYQAGLAFAGETSAVRAQDELGWQVAAKVARSGDAASVVEISVRDVAGAALTGLTASAQLTHPTDRRLDHVVTLVAGAPGQFAGSTEPVAGQWDLLVELARDGKRVFRSKNRITVH